MAAPTDPFIYYIQPTKLIPNSPKPLLLYKNAFVKDGKVDTTAVFNTLHQNAWDVQWVTRYGHHQRSHYHSESHEVMVVLSGPGRIRWGVADLSEDWKEHTYGTAFEEGGIDVEVNVGDMFVIPAGVAHKSYDPLTTTGEWGCLTGSARGVSWENPTAEIAKLPMEGFTMMGAYPRGFSWTWEEGGDSEANFQAVWNVRNPENDPVVGEQGGINKLWRDHRANL